MTNETQSPTHDSAPASGLALVTGASGAIGKAIAEGIARDHRFEVVLVCRNEARASAATEAVRRATGNPRVRYELADLSRRASIEAMAAHLTGPVQVLVNDAAVTPRRREETPEGIELQLATNVLGYFWLTRACEPLLRQATGARVVNVASYWAGGLDLEDLEFRHRRYHNDTAYRQSKQANRMLTRAFAERLGADGIAVNACHPGDVSSVLSNNLGFGGHESPAQGAATPVWLATGETGGRVSGCYFEHQREVHCPFVRDAGAVEALYQACLGYA